MKDNAVTAEATPQRRRTYTVDHVAKELGLGRNQTYEAVRRGDIPAIRIGHRWLVLAEPFDAMLSGGRDAA